MSPRRFLSEQSLHTGKIAYLYAPGLSELEYPVLIEPVEEHYDYVVARAPVIDEAGLFFNVWEPTQSMQFLVSDMFGGLYHNRRGPLVDDYAIWEAIRIIHHKASIAYGDTRDYATFLIKEKARVLTNYFGVIVPPASLASVAEMYGDLGSLVLPHPTTASFAPATMLLMLGVPRDRVAVFGVYYQDPMVYYSHDSDWRAGFLTGTPYYTVMGVLLGGQWTIVDMMLLATYEGGNLPSMPQMHHWPAHLGYHPDDGQPLIIDYKHPYTMIFSPPYEYEAHPSPGMSRIPLLGDEWIY